jgi:S-adenosylmethionine:diacylglycerol 3-amino-3-carboxypropyl transferase
VYSFTTENLSGYFPHLPFKDASVLTVGGSGDQIINAYLHGASEVTAFDINTHSAFYTDLKLAALEHLEFERFKKFLFREDKQNAFNFGTYQKIRGSMNDISVQFFDQEYHNFSYDGQELRESKLFNNRFDNNELKIMSNPYLQSEENYNKAKNNLKKTRWFRADVKDLADILEEESFDIVLFSNIADYAYKMYPETDEHLKEFCSGIIEPIIPNIYKGGILCAAYIYDVLGNTEDDIRHVNNSTLRRKVFKETGQDYQEMIFESVIEGKKDAVVILRRKR